MFEIRLHVFRRFATANFIVVIGMSILFAGTACAHDLVNTFGFDSPFVYIEAGLEENPLPGDHSFPGVPGFFIQEPPAPPVPPEWYYWDPNELPEPTPETVPPPPPTFTNYGPGIGVQFQGASVHTYAPHMDDVVPSTKWSYDITVAEPSVMGGWGPTGWWWAGENRIRGSVPHPEAGHTDAYMAVVGVLRGTYPGPDMTSRRVIIGGSVGVHVSPPLPSSPQPLFGGALLTPPSLLPSLEGDLPGGVLISILDTATSQLTMQLIVDGLQAGMISSIFLRNGQNGPILMDLLPMMQMQHLGPIDTVLTIQQAVMPVTVAQAIGAGNAYVSVEFPMLIHPDGKIAGLLSAVTGVSGDYNDNGDVNAADYVSWRDHLGAVSSLPNDATPGTSAGDYGFWKQNFGAPSGAASSAAVPEPSGYLLQLLGCFAFASHRFARRGRKTNNHRQSR